LGFDFKGKKAADAVMPFSYLLIKSKGEDGNFEAWAIS